jgi:metal-responsive CopG/Arc/MetJ family transcriptional regulator
VGLTLLVLFLVYGVRAMAKKPSIGGFRLDLGEPLATQLSEYCNRNFRNKTELIREALKLYFESRDKESAERETRQN